MNWRCSQAWEIIMNDDFTAAWALAREADQWSDRLDSADCPSRVLLYLIRQAATGLGLAQGTMHSIFRNPNLPISSVVPLIGQNPWILEDLWHNPALPLYDLEHPEAGLVARVEKYVQAKRQAKSDR